METILEAKEPLSFQMLTSAGALMSPHKGGEGGERRGRRGRRGRRRPKWCNRKWQEVKGIWGDYRQVLSKLQSVLCHSQ